MCSSSAALTTAQVYRLWSWLPPAYAIMDPVLLFSGGKHGYNLRTLLALVGTNALCPLCRAFVCSSL